MYTCIFVHVYSEILSYYCIQLEVGVQSVYEYVALDTNCGYIPQAVCESFQLVKYACCQIYNVRM